jgi:transcriptional regulator with XRE-family HTH domain
MTADAALLQELVMIRWRNGLTQQDVADQTGMPRSAVARLENSSRLRRAPNLDTLLRYAHAIGAEIHATETTIR